MAPARRRVKMGRIKIPKVRIRDTPGAVVMKKPPKAAAPKPTPIPYSEYAAYPWAQRQLAGIDRDQAHHEKYAGETVAPWLSASLKGLTGVDPAQPGLNTQAQQQYQANVAGQVGGALGAVAAAAPMNVGGLAPGAVAGSPFAFLGNAAREAAGGRASAALQQAQVQGQLNTLMPNTYAQGIVRTFADYQAGLPGLYAQKRNDARNKIDQFILEFEESNRRARVSESISAWNAQTNAAFQAAQLGQDAQEFAADQTQATTEAAAPVPYGFVRLPNGNIVRDPAVPAASTTQGTQPTQQGDKYTRSWFLEKGYRPVPPKAGRGYQQRAIASVDGSGKWIKPGAAGGGGKPPKVLTVTELESTLTDLYKPGDVGGWEERYDNNPKGAATAVARWVRENRPSFTKTGKKADLAKIRQVLSTVGGRPAVLALDILTRGYINADGTWK